MLRDAQSAFRTNSEVVSPCFCTLFQRLYGLALTFSIIVSVLLRAGEFVVTTYIHPKRCGIIM